MFQVKLNKNNMELTIPHQAFIDNEFVDASNGQTFKTINPADEQVRRFILETWDTVVHLFDSCYAL